MSRLISRPLPACAWPECSNVATWELHCHGNRALPSLLAIYCSNHRIAGKEQHDAKCEYAGCKSAPVPSPEGGAK